MAIPYVRHISQLATGTALAQAITIGAAPLLTRLYSPSEYGVAATYAAVVGVVGVAGAFRYDFAIVLASDDLEARDIVALSSYIAGAVALTSMAVTAILRATTNLRALEQLGWLALLLPASIGAYALMLVCMGWSNRLREYKILARSRVINSFIAAGASIVSRVAFHTSASGLILGALLGYLGSAVFLASRSSMSPFGAIAAGAPRLRRVAYKFRQFPQFNLGMTVLDQLTSSLPILLFTTFFSAATAAYFALANNVLRLPLAVVGQAIGQVFFERAARQQSNASGLKQLVLSNMKMLALLIAPVAVVVVVAGPMLFKFVFGTQWATAGVYARYLVVASCFSFVAAPISTIPSVVQQQHVHLAISSFAFLVRIAAIWGGVSIHSPAAAVMLYSAGEVITITTFLIWLQVMLRRRAAAPMEFAA